MRNHCKISVFTRIQRFDHFYTADLKICLYNCSLLVSIHTRLLGRLSPHPGAENSAPWWGFIVLALDPLGSKDLAVEIQQIRRSDWIMGDGWLSPKISFFYRFSTPESCKSSFLAWKLSKMLFDPESRAKLEESLGLDGPSRFLGMGYLYPLPLRFDSGYLLRSLTDLRHYGKIYPFNLIRLFNLFERSQSVQRIKRSAWILR
jgi:hypothetical protein